MTEKTMTLEGLLARLPEMSLDGYTDKKTFLEKLDKYPDLSVELRYQLSLSCNADWIAKAQNEDLTFGVYDDSWKPSNAGLIPNRVQLTFVGKENIPVVSIDIHRKPV